MSADEIRTEQRSSVKISTSASGRPIPEVKAYSHDLDTLEATRVAAIVAYRATLSDLGLTMVAK